MGSKFSPRAGTQRHGNEVLEELLAEQRRTNELLERLVSVLEKTTAATEMVHIQ